MFYKQILHTNTKITSLTNSNEGWSPGASPVGQENFIKIDFGNTTVVTKVNYVITNAKVDIYYWVIDYTINLFSILGWHYENFTSCICKHTHIHRNAHTQTHSHSVCVCLCMLRFYNRRQNSLNWNLKIKLNTSCKSIRTIIKYNI